jgi:hypothetical protein
MPRLLTVDDHASSLVSMAGRFERKVGESGATSR